MSLRKFNGEKMTEVGSGEKRLMINKGQKMGKIVGTTAKYRLISRFLIQNKLAATND
jgi:hypothetical protein